MITPRNPVASSPDDDPTGVRALLFSLPEPEPMPAYLIERINASLAAEQAQRAATSSGTSVTPLLATSRRRPGRLLFAIAGAAAAVVVVAVVGSNLFKTIQPALSNSTAAAAISSGPRVAGGGEPQRVNGTAVPGSPSTPPLVQNRKSGTRNAQQVIQISLSGTRYTQADFVMQARTLRVALEPIPALAADSLGVGAVGTALGLTDCLSAIGAGGAQMVRADLAFYEGAPAVIIVATTNGVPTAYAVGRQCSLADAAVLRPATPLP